MAKRNKEKKAAQQASPQGQSNQQVKQAGAQGQTSSQEQKQVK